jgi:hypothetical protein
VNEREVATVVLQGHRGERFIETVQAVPPEIVAASAEGSMRVTFRAREGSRVGRIYEVRVVRTATP